MLSTQGFTLHKDRPSEGEELFETKMHTQKMKCASSPVMRNSKRKMED
jgi:hypothetical protein